MDKTNLLFLACIILFVILFYKINNLEKQNIENFDATTDSINVAVKAIYNADVESIRNLSSLATQLTTNGSLTCPGNLKISNGVQANSSINADGSVSFANGNFTIDTNGNITKCGKVNTTGDLNVGGILNVTNDINGQGDVNIQQGKWFRCHGGGSGIYWQDYGGGWIMNDNVSIKSLSDKQIYSATITAGRQLNSNGNLQVNGDLQVNGTTNIGDLHTNTGNFYSDKFYRMNVLGKRDGDCTQILGGRNIQNC
jgi:hypothetical protein